MALNKYSAFYYGHTVNRQNRNLNFKDAGISSPEQYIAQVDIGSYTISQFANEIAKAMNSAGSQEYTITLDRVTRRITISAPANFELLIDSGNQKTISVFSLLGFTGSVDLTGSNSYESDSPSGESYITQTPLRNFSDFKDNKEKAEAVVKTTPRGIVESIGYGVLERMSCDLPLITNFVPQRFIRETATGVEEARAFMDYAITKSPMEFIEDYQDPNNFTTCILDRTRKSTKGVGYELREKTRQSLPGYYELTRLTFLKVEAI